MYIRLSRSLVICILNFSLFHFRYAICIYLSIYPPKSPPISICFNLPFTSDMLLVHIYQSHVHIYLPIYLSIHPSHLLFQSILTFSSRYAISTYLSISCSHLSHVHIYLSIYPLKSPPVPIYFNFFFLSLHIWRCYQYIYISFIMVISITVWSYLSISASTCFYTYFNIFSLSVQICYHYIYINFIMFKSNYLSHAICLYLLLFQYI